MADPSALVSSKGVLETAIQPPDAGVDERLQG